MSGLSVSGIASGIDSKSIISQMVSLETKSITKYQQRIALEEAERIAFQDLSSRLQSLKSAMGAFSNGELFSSLSSSSSDEDIVTVTASDDAPRGNHSIKVMQTAQAHRIGGSGVADPINTRITAGFSKSDFGVSTSFADLEAGSKSLNTVAASGFEYETNISLSGQYTGDENINISVELLSDVSGPDGTVDLRISTDGLNYETYTGVAVDGGQINLSSADHFDGNGISLTIENADSSMKNGDTFSFRAYGQASLEYSIGNGERKELALSSDETLASLVKKINDDSSLGLRADIMNDGSASDSYRLLLTSLTEGSSGQIDILHNASSINLNGVSAEAPVAQSNTYTGVASVSGTLSSGSGNTSVVLEMMTGGALADAKFRISSDGGLTFHDNKGEGFSLSGPDGNGDYSFDLDSALTDDHQAIFSSALDIDLKLSNAGIFTAGDRVSIDLFDAEVQSAQDALVNVNGITMVKSTNTLDDVFEGMTLNLQDAAPDRTINIEVSENVGDVASVMNGFVEAYNSVMSLIHAQSKYNPAEDSEAPLLMGDSTIRQIQSNLQNFITRRHNDQGPSALADLGISTDSKTGLISFDSAQLSKALSDDANGVRRLLGGLGESSPGATASFISSTSKTEAGSYNVRVTQARTRAVVQSGLSQTLTSNEELSFRINSDAQGTGNIRAFVVSLTSGMDTLQQVEAIQNALDARDLQVTASLQDGKITIRHNEYGDDYEIEVTSNLDGDSGFKKTTVSGVGTDLEGTISGVKAEARGDVLVGKAGYKFEGLQVKVANDFEGNAGQISLSEGIGQSFSALLDSFVGFGGLLSNKIDSFDSVISRFEEQMTKVTERATRLEERLRQQFVNLEVTLGRLNSTGEYLIAQLQTLPGVTRNK
jgi:flagellar hook-associated protein 2